MATKPKASENKFKVLKDWLLNSWGGLVFSLLSFVGIIGATGYNIGAYITRNEYETKMINMRIDHQTEINNARDDAKSQAVAEMKQQSDQIQMLYSIMSSTTKITQDTTKR